MRLEQYTDRQARIDRSFVYSASSCSVTCGACGRTYFVTSPGHGDYEEFELARLQRLAEEHPDKYIEVDDFGSVSILNHPLTGKTVVVGCLCDPTDDLSEFIESYQDELRKYLYLLWRAKAEEAERELTKMTQNLKDLEED